MTVPSDPVRAAAGAAAAASAAAQLARRARVLPVARRCRRGRRRMPAAAAGPRPPGAAGSRVRRPTVPPRPGPAPVNRIWHSSSVKPEPVRARSRPRLGQHYQASPAPQTRPTGRLEVCHREIYYDAALPQLAKVVRLSSCSHTMYGAALQSRQSAASQWLL